MRKFYITLAVTCLLALPAWAGEITVAAAANLQFTLEEIKNIFEQETGIKVKTIIGSSGKLTTQIENGAPFDLFMSADEDYPRRLYKGGMTMGEPKVYAYGILVLWSLNGVDLSKGLAVLNDSAVGKIAIASPKAAPYGRQAVNAMKHAQLYPGIASKLVYGENIAQVNQFVITQAADIGFTAKSIVLAANMKGKGQWVELDPQAYEPIAQAVVVLNYAKPREAVVKKFYDFLFSPQAQEIFKQYGYALP